ncbi:monovalent cation/H+ antiporter subunit D family protein [Natronobacterium gregoryi]|uniref:Formate hydrogenlyase subunit 3/multisubunit Na+/H+ antiporter, MnhD subunit n=2 Tax=Natronobacterium gregoryi TaxID=44930 RepID=L0ALZ8_NATGS|nr:monovalent cation/H+ antiporter subunit D family protein [Natronobacterium gregoryi]AFZ74192.1 formate hydrogenlyase subunit 3/multisubunit Na+/H+ antiporter, MnhD subunit [Natronobacterium gregoryi SP2]ELY63647.1 monovalent cation/H+ antiporter subunit D [Natronobacterium gregoryi SP2]PLK22018.1 monovalent cation/H+ antiporter subunit D family protein [Natronobacterium gregoryi SP2]SFI51198.1 multisubunit sodium/proton antiporter, MrpD subunit [Natronobacterium gregoryi]
MDWLLAVIVLLPLLSATVPIAATVRWKGVGWSFASLIVTVTFGLSVILTWMVARDGQQSHELGGVPTPYGIELFADEFSIVVILLVLLVCLGVLVYTRVGGPRGNAFYGGFLLLVGGMLGILLTGDLFNMYVFLEIMAISSYALVSASKYRWSTYAAFKYLLVGTVGAGFYLLGVALMLASTGTLTMRRLPELLADVGYTDPVVTAAFVLITVGLGIKIALFPVHTWLADAHASAPDGISAVISALVPAVALYAFARVMFTVFTMDFLAANPTISNLLLVAALFSLFAGGFFALLQDHIKLVLAYSTVSQFGLIFVGIAIANETAVFGSILQIFGHGVVKASLFVLAGMFALRFGGIRTLEEYAGVAKRAPVMAGAFAVLAVAMIGLPPTVGFVGKWYIALGAFEEGMWLVSLLVLGSTLLSAGYLLPFVNRIYFHPFDGEDVDPTAITKGMLIAIVIGAVIGLTLGFASAEIQEAVSGAVEGLVA